MGYYSRLCNQSYSAVGGTSSETTVVTTERKRIAEVPDTCRPHKKSNAAKKKKWERWNDHTVFLNKLPGWPNLIKITADRPFVNIHYSLQTGLMHQLWPAVLTVIVRAHSHFNFKWSRLDHLSKLLALLPPVWPSNLSRAFPFSDKMLS